MKSTLHFFAVLSTPLLIAAIWLGSSSNIRTLRAEDAKVSIEPRARPSTDSAGEPSGSANRLDGRFQANSTLVLVPVLVTDNQDRLVTGLDKERFKLFEDKVEQPIIHFGSEDLPMTVGVVFDCSGSMGAKLQQSRAAVAEFLKIANPEDEFSLVEFSDTANLTVPLTDHADDIQNHLFFTRSKGRTALLDALYLALQEMKRANRTRKALLVISDGGDNASRYTIREVKNLIRETDVQIYAIGIFEPLSQRAQTIEELDGPELLSSIAGTTGGRLFEVQDPKDLPPIAAKIGVALRHTYLLGFSPNADKWDGKYHRIQVKMERVKGTPPLHASFRAGYYAPAP